MQCPYFMFLFSYWCNVPILDRDQCLSIASFHSRANHPSHQQNPERHCPKSDQPLPITKQKYYPIVIAFQCALPIRLPYCRETDAFAVNTGVDYQYWPQYQILRSDNIKHRAWEMTEPGSLEKVQRYETFLNERLRGDLRKCLEQRDKIYEEQAEFLALRNSIQGLLF